MARCRDSRSVVDNRAGAAVCLTGCRVVHTPTQEQLHQRKDSGKKLTNSEIVELADVSGDKITVGEAVFLGLKKVRRTIMPL